MDATDGVTMREKRVWEDAMQQPAGPTRELRHLRSAAASDADNVSSLYHSIPGVFLHAAARDAAYTRARASTHVASVRRANTNDRVEKILMWVRRTVRVW